MIEYRKSSEADKNDIVELIDTRFGIIDLFSVTDKLNDRYLLAFDNNKLITMTGLIDFGSYNGPEIDLTCILKEYEGRGIINHMIGKVIKDYNGDIYCSCWRLNSNDKINLHHSMEKLGFKLAVKERIKFNSKYDKCIAICVNSKLGCSCCEDLYIREATS